MTMTPLPPAPSSKDPTSFDDRADELLAVALPRFAEEANALALDVSTKQETASAAAVTATGQAGIATTKAGEAGDHASAANSSKEAAAASDLSAFTNMGFAEQAAIAANESKLAAAESAATIDPQAVTSEHYSYTPPLVTYPGMVWADRGTLTRKRRNDDDTAWIIEGRLFRAHLPIIPLAEVPTTDIGQISVITIGTMEWDAGEAKYTALVDKGAGIPLCQTMWWPLRSSIQAGYAALDGQELSQATYPDFHAALVAGILPSVNEATWQADPTQRGKFVVTSTAGKFRLPDYNGMSPGSLGAVVQRGDGAKSAGEAGVIQRDAMQNVSGSVASVSGGSAPTGVFYLSGVSGITQAGGTNIHHNLLFDLSREARTSTETRMTNVTGCFVIKLFGAVTNAGSADAAQLASDYANLAAAHQTLDGQLDFTIIYPNGGSEAAPANVVINSVYALSNPFPGHLVQARPELFIGGKWGTAAFSWAGSAPSYGILTQQGGAFGEVLDLITGVTNLVLGTRNQTGHNFNPAPGPVTTAPCRVLVWKLKGAI